MPTVTVNCEALPCPQPVMKLKKLLEASCPTKLTIIVDNEPALENVSRFLASQGFVSSHDKLDNTWIIQAQRVNAACSAVTDKEPHSAAAPSSQTKAGEEMKTLVMLISPVFGEGDDELGKKLMKNFISTLPEMGNSLWRIVLLNGGVELATQSSHVLEELRLLESLGVSVLVCGTCLEHFKLLKKKAVGETTNMLDVVTSMQLAEKIIRV